MINEVERRHTGDKLVDGTEALGWRRWSTDERHVHNYAVTHQHRRSLTAADDADDMRTVFEWDTDWYVVDLLRAPIRAVTAQNNGDRLTARHGVLPTIFHCILLRASYAWWIVAAADVTRMRKKQNATDGLLHQRNVTMPSLFADIIK